MKLLCFVSVVCLWQIVQSKHKSDLKTTVIHQASGKHAFIMRWGPEPNWDENDPIIGYKIVVWEMEPVKKPVLVDGEIKFEIDYDHAASEYAVGQPQIFEASADNRTVVVENIKPEVWYEYSLFAFTKKGEGPMTTPIGLKVGGSKNSTASM